MVSGCSYELLEKRETSIKLKPFFVEMGTHKVKYNIKGPQDLKEYQKTKALNRFTANTDLICSEDDLLFVRVVTLQALDPIFMTNVIFHYKCPIVAAV